MAKNTDIRYRNQLLYSVFVTEITGKNGTFKDVEEDLDRIKSLGTGHHLVHAYSSHR